MQSLTNKKSSVILNSTFFKSGLLLLFPGIVTSIGLILLASGSFSWIDRKLTTYLVQLVQLQMLGLTICKFGADQIGFALMKEHKAQQLNIGQLYIKRVVPLVVIYAAIMYFFHPLFILFGIILLLEVFSLIVITEENACKRHLNASFLMLCGYPLLFFIIVVISLWGTLTGNMMLLLMLASSAVKFLFSLSLRKKQSVFSSIDCSIDVQIPIQQGLNFFLFRFDQILLSTLLIKFAVFDQLAIADLLFLSKYPELISGVLTGLGVMFIHPMSDDFVESINLFLRKYCNFLLLLLLGTFAIGISHFCLGKFNNGHILILYVLFFINSLLALPANIATYHLLRKNKFKQINKLSFLSMLCGMIIALISIYIKNVLLFALIIPVQLGVYIILFKKTAISKLNK